MTSVSPSTKTLQLESTPKMARFVQWLQDNQANELKSQANDQVWDYLTSLPPEAHS
jgi:4-alpha-glucanotransferase